MVLSPAEVASMDQIKAGYQTAYAKRTLGELARDTATAVKNGAGSARGWLSRILHLHALPSMWRRAGSWLDAYIGEPLRAVFGSGIGGVLTMAGLLVSTARGQKTIAWVADKASIAANWIGRTLRSIGNHLGSPGKWVVSHAEVVVNVAKVYVDPKLAWVKDKLTPGSQNADAILGATASRIAFNVASQFMPARHAMAVAWVAVLGLWNYLRAPVSLTTEEALAAAQENLVVAEADLVAAKSAATTAKASADAVAKAQAKAKQNAATPTTTASGTAA